LQFIYFFFFLDAAVAQKVVKPSKEGHAQVEKVSSVLLIIVTLIKRTLAGADPGFFKGA